MIELQYAQQGVHYNGILIEHKVVGISKALIATVAQLEATLKLLDATGQQVEKGMEELAYWCNLNAIKNEQIRKLEAEIAALKSG